MDRTIVYNITANTSGFTSGISSVQSSLNNVSSTLKDVGKKMLAVGASLEAGVAGLAYAGMKYDASIASTDFMMSKLSDTVQDSIKTGMKQAKSLGLTEKQYRENAASIALMYKRMGNTDEAINDMTTSTVNLAADLAAFADVTPQEAMDSLSSALVGNFNAMDKYRISLSAAGIENGDYVKSLGKTYDELSPLEKQTAIYNEIMRQGADYTGLAQTEASSANSQFNYLKTTLGETAGQIGATLIPILIPLFQKLVEVTEKVRDWVAANPELVRVILIVVAAIGALLMIAGLALIVIGTIIGIIAVWQTVTAAFTVIQWLLNAAIAFLTSPIGLVILAIVALIAIGVLLWKNWDAIMAWFSDIWEKFKGWAEDAWNGLKDAVKAAVDWVKEKWDNFIGGIKAAWDTIKGIWNKLFGGGSNSTITVTDGTGGGSTQKHAKGAIFTGLTNIGNHQFGEAGHEAVVPLTPQGLRVFSEGMGLGSTNIYNFDKVDLTSTDSIRRLAQELNKLQNRDARAKGIGYGYGG